MATISANGENKYLNFTNVLNGLDWTKLDGADTGRNAVATQLQKTINTNFSDFSDKYTLTDYRAIVDGYINRQASYQGSLEGIASSIATNTT